MAVELKIDTIEDSTVELGTIDRRIIRRAIVSGLESATTHGYQFAALRVAGMPQLRDRHPQQPDMFLQWQRVRGRAGDTMEVELEYRPNQVTAFIGGAISFSDRTSLSSEFAESMLTNAALEPFTINPVGQDDPTYKVAGRMQKFNPIRQLDVEAMLTFRPTGARDAVGTVNASTWCGYPKGYWMCVGVQTVIQSFQPGGVSYRASFLNRVYRNWMEWDFARDQIGRIQNGAQTNDALGFLRGEGYMYGIRRLQGVTVAGQYPMINFRNAFGFNDERASVLNFGPNQFNTLGYSGPITQLPPAR